MNVCVLGDSIAKGVVLDQTKNKYYFLKDSFINTIVSEKTVDIKNYSKFGSTINKGEEILEKHRDEIRDYDFTVIEFGGNDSDLPWSEIADCPLEEHHANVPLDIFTKKYQDMIDKIKALGSKPIIATLPPLNPQRFFDWVTRGLDREAVLNFLGRDVNYIYRWHESYNDELYKLALKNHVPLLDIRQAFINDKDYNDCICLDGMHPNAKGHRRIADYIEKNTDIFVRNDL